MNSVERLRRRLAGEPVDRPPNFNIMMTFAAHYIGEKLSNYYNDHRVLVEANLAVQRDFDLDIVQAISDPYREAHDFGAVIAFPEDDLPLCRHPLIAEPEDLAQLRPPDPATGPRMSDRVEAIRLFREKVGGEVPIMGWVEGALAGASVLRGVVNLLYDVSLRPEWVDELLEMCAEVEIAFARAQVEAGADIIGLGDAIASQISPAMYRRFALPYEKRIFDAVHEMGALARLHICGNTNHLLNLMPESGADIIDLDWMVDLDAAVEAFAGRCVTMGNFDPVSVMLQGTPDGVRAAAIRCLEIGGKRSISAAGCEVPVDTPHENLRAHAAVLREVGGAL